MVLAKVMPRIEIGDVKTEALGDGLYKVVAEVGNAGYIPTATEMAKKLKRVDPVRATLSGKDVEVLVGGSEISVGHLAGQPSRPGKATWTVKAKAPFEITVSAYVPTGGRDTKTVKVEK